VPTYFRGGKVGSARPQNPWTNPYL